MDGSMSLTDTLALALIMLPVLAIICGATVVIVRRQSHRGTSPEDQAQMQALGNTARRMEQRMGYLENVLDTEAPGWRSRSESR